MSRDKRMNTATNSLHGVQYRAGKYVDASTFGRHQDKRLAEIFGCSPSMAYRLKRGEGWTIERVAQASRHFGRAFLDHVFAPVTGQPGGDLVSTHVAQLKASADALVASALRGPFGLGPGADRVGDPPVAADGGVRADRVALRDHRDGN